jgi:hypothetical protein
MTTFLEYGYDGRQARLGFAGPKLYAGRPARVWFGSADELALFVIVRCEDRYVDVELTTSASGRMIAPHSSLAYGLRFAAMRVPDGVDVLAVSGKTVSGEATLFWPRRPSDGMRAALDAATREP